MEHQRLVDRWSIDVFCRMYRLPILVGEFNGDGHGHSRLTFRAREEAQSSSIPSKSWVGSSGIRRHSMY